MKVNDKDKLKSSLPKLLNMKCKVVKEENYDFGIKYGINLIDFSVLKRGLAVIGLSFLLWSCSSKEEFVPYININMEIEEMTYFAECSLGKVYICEYGDVDKYKNLLCENDILVIDKRKTDNPDMCVYNSHRIRDFNVIMEVLLILKEYEERYPTDWNRTVESMYNEWIIHNIFYRANIRVGSTAHVDLDNEDEKIYDSYILSKMLNKNRWN